MLVYRFITQRNNTSTYILMGIILLIWSSFTYTKILEFAQSSQAPLGLFQALTGTFQSLHNQLYFFIPTLTIAWLLLFKTPTHHELIILTNNHRLNSFIWGNILEMMLIFVLASSTGCLVAGITHPQLLRLDFQNIILGLLLLSLNMLGLVISWHILAELTILFNKLAAASLWFMFILIDYLLFQTIGWSIYLTNGLSLTSLNYDFYILTDIFLYTGYIYLLNLYPIKLLKWKSVL